MRYRLDLILRPAEGALLRVIGTAERRGYTPLAVEGRQQQDAQEWHLMLLVEGERGADSLRKQMEKLYDCLSVEIREEAIA